MDVSKQDVEISSFCLAYVLSGPFQSCQQSDQMAQAARDGFYALQDYAAFHIYRTLTAIPGLSDEQIHRLDQNVAAPLQRFLNLFHVSKPSFHGPLALNSDPTPEARNHVIQVESTHDFWRDFELQVSLIRDVIEKCRADDCLNAEGSQEMEEIYGKLSFKCPRICCHCFDTGFKSKSLRENHVRRHERPIFCTEKGCPFGELGFETNVQLEKHLVHTHAKDSGNSFKFPQPSNRKGDKIWQACARGDINAVRRHLGNGCDVNPGGMPRNKPYTPLYYAAVNSHFDICKLLIEAGAEISTNSQRRGENILHVAASQNDIELVEYLVRLRPDNLNIRALDHRKRTALDLAISAKAAAVVGLLEREYEIELTSANLRDAATVGDAAKVKLLLAAENMTPERADSHQRTALHFASTAAVANLLLGSGKYNINQRDATGRSPLSHAAAGGRIDVISLLLHHHAEIDSMDNRMRTPLMDAASGLQQGAIEILLQNHANVDSIDADQRSAIIYAILEDHRPSVEMLLRYGANAYLHDRDGQTPMEIARAKNKWSSVDALVKHGVPESSRGKNRRNLLQIAISNGHYSLVVSLLRHGGADPNKPDSLGRTPLVSSVIFGDRPIFRFLIGLEGLNVDTPDMQNRTALSYAAGRGDIEMISRLLDLGASVNSCDRTGRTCFSYAATRDGSFEAFEAFLSKHTTPPTIPWDLDAADHLGLTPLSHAVIDEKVNVVRSLLNIWDVNPYLPDLNNRTALSHAVVTGNFEIISILLDSRQFNINQRDKWNFTPLSRAISYGDPIVVKALLRTGTANVSDKDWLLQSAKATKPEVAAKITSLLLKYLP